MNYLKQLFIIKYGNRGYSDKSVLDKGKTILIASQGVENGVYGFFDIPKFYDPPIITVPRTGSIGYAFVQLDKCNVTDDCIILIPKKRMAVEYLFYVATVIRVKKWRFNYARKVTPGRLGQIEIKSPDEFITSISFARIFKEQYPPKNRYNKNILNKVTELKKIIITELFELERGSFHAIDRLEKGDLPTISRVSENNGLVGFYKKPQNSKIYHKYIITISTVTGDAFLQFFPFIATDNVVMCIPKREYQLTTLIYIQTFLNKVKWRYSYGRQCYKRIFQKTTIFLPIKEGGELDEEYMKEIVINQPYWKAFKNTLTFQS